MTGKSESNQISDGEEELLTSIGYIVMRWNYAEYFARQTLRQYLSGDSMEDPDHLKLSSRSASRLEDQLRTDVLPIWQEPGRAFLERLVLAFSRGRDYRNHFVHGIFMTHRASGPNEPLAILFPPMPKNGKPQIPSHVTFSEVRAIANHFHDLAMFSREVNIAFARDGTRAVDAGGQPLLRELPEMLSVLNPLQYQTTESLGIAGDA